MGPGRSGERLQPRDGHSLDGDFFRFGCLFDGFGDPCLQDAVAEVGVDLVRFHLKAKWRPPEEGSHAPFVWNGISSFLPN